MIWPHTHTCAHCGHEWACGLPTKPAQTVCPVDAAAKVNKAGPACLLCHHLVLAGRVATRRGLTDKETAQLLTRLRDA